MLDSGVAPSTAELALSARRQSTETIYGHKWATWSSWCEEGGVSATSPTPGNLADFLTFLFKEKKLAPSTIRGYRAAVSTTIRQLGGPDFSQVQLLSDVSRAMSLADARAPRRLPAWDLFLVLEVLRGKTFEPLGNASFKLLTYKTVFLLALATCRRRSEVHGISGRLSDISFLSDGAVSLRFLPEFLAKNQVAGRAAPPLVVRPLTDIVGREDDDRLLCPVRALRFYLDRTKHRRGGALRRLFLSLNEDYGKDLSAGSISRWLSATVLLAYRTKEVEATVLNPRAHELRALSSSLAFSHSISLPDFLEAAYWRSENPFTSHYLRDVRASRLDGAFSIRVIAAGLQCVATRPSASSL